MIDRARVLARLQEAEAAGRQGIAAGEAVRALCDIAVVELAAVEAESRSADSSPPVC